jgi:hypothetical protein
MVAVSSNHNNNNHNTAIAIFDRGLRKDGGLLLLLLLLSIPLLVIQLLSIDGENGKPEERLMMNVADANSHINMTALLERDTLDNIRPYDLTDVLRVIPYYDHAMALIIYDPIDDQFFAYYSTNHKWKRGCEELIASFKMIVFILRRLFPQRFAPTSPEFAMVISAGDVPGVRVTSCVRRKDYPCSPLDLPPILHFGHVFQLPLFPSMIAMPSSKHLKCFNYWTRFGSVCEEFQPIRPGNPNGLVFGDNVDLAWEYLIPQVIWRGEDHHVFQSTVSDLIPPGVTGSDAMDVLRKHMDELTPQYKGVVYTADAEREARETPQAGKLPWANIKFSNHAKDSEMYLQFRRAGIPVTREYMDNKDLAKFRYQIDLGGGNAAGTLEKLAMPGALLHHVTSTKEYYFNRMKPYEHYIPVAPDLSDLWGKYVWAESESPVRAKKISEQASKLAASFGTPAGFENIFEEYMRQPLQRVLEAYEPSMYKPWRTIVNDHTEGSLMKPIIRCTASGPYHCQNIVGRKFFEELLNSKADEDDEEYY